jgi:hypothetical protein
MSDGRGLTCGDLLGRVYELSGSGQHQTATALIFDWVDRKCSEGAWEEIDAVLAAVDPARLASFARRSFATITACVKAKLPSRPAYLEAAYAATVADRGEERATRIFRHLW